MTAHCWCACAASCTILGDRSYLNRKAKRIIGALDTHKAIEAVKAIWAGKRTLDCSFESAVVCAVVFGHSTVCGAGGLVRLTCPTVPANRARQAPLQEPLRVKNARQTAVRWTDPNELHPVRSSL